MCEPLKGKRYDINYGSGDPTGDLFPYDAVHSAVKWVKREIRKVIIGTEEIEEIIDEGFADAVEEK